MNLPKILENQRLITLLEIGLFVALILIAVKTFEIGNNIETMKTMMENGQCSNLAGEFVWK